MRGEVKNYVPVTDAMLRDPDPGDWLMIRRNYQAWSNSALKEITSANVKDLQLQWVWAMDESGANEPTPIVHGGTMFLANTSNIVQALDARTGDLIWQNQVGPTVGQGGTVAIQEFIPNEERTGPPDALIFAVNMLVNTEAGDTFTFAEMSGWLREAGFVNPRLLDVPWVSPLVLANKP